MPTPFRAFVESTWTMLVDGWANHLDADGTNLLIDGIRNAAESHGSYEGVTRMMWGLGGWFSQPGRPATVSWRDRTHDLEALMIRALDAGTNPASPGYWGDPASTGSGQPTVESGQVAYAIWQSRDRVWSQLDDACRDRVIAWLEACGEPPADGWRNNWALFWVLNHAVRGALGGPFDQAIVDDVIGTYLDRVYVGNGWYDDGPERGTNHFDDYALWVFTSHVLAWIEIDGDRLPKRAGELLDRVRLLMQPMPTLFAANGAWPEYGRSGAYKFARLGAFVWAWRQGAWPHSPGLLRTIVERHIGWYTQRGAVRADGTLRQSLTATGSDAIRESYISTGAPYWAMQAFGALWSLPDDDPLWSVDPEPLPIERDDIHLVLPEPGWIITGTRESGQIHRFTVHTAGYPAKYAKLAYSTAAPYNAGLGRGLPTPDAMIGFVVDDLVSHRRDNEAALIHQDGWIRYRHRHELADAWMVFDTIVIPRGDAHLRLHRVVASSTDNPLATIEGASALGFDDGDQPQLVFEPDLGICGGTAAGHAIAIRTWDRKRISQWPGAFADGGRGNVVYGQNVIPYVSGELGPGDIAITTVFLGSAHHVRTLDDVTARLGDAPEVTWHPDGSVDAAWKGSTWVIAALPAGSAG